MSGTDISGQTIPNIFLIPISNQPPAHIITLDELLASHEAILFKETTDKANISHFVNINSESIRASMFGWASQGFPDIYPIMNLQITPPPACSDGVVRTLYEYVEYCMGITMAQMVTNIQLRVKDIEISYSFSGNTLRLHVSRMK